MWNIDSMIFFRKRLCFFPSLKQRFTMQDFFSKGIHFDFKMTPFVLTGVYTLHSLDGKPATHINFNQPGLARNVNRSRGQNLWCEKKRQCPMKIKWSWISLNNICFRIYFRHSKKYKFTFHTDDRLSTIKHFSLFIFSDLLYDEVRKHNILYFAHRKIYLFCNTLTTCFIF